MLIVGVRDGLAVGVALAIVGLGELWVGEADGVEVAAFGVAQPAISRIAIPATAQVIRRRRRRW